MGRERVHRKERKGPHLPTPAPGHSNRTAYELLRTILKLSDEGLSSTEISPSTGVEEPVVRTIIDITREYEKREAASEPM